MSNETYEDIAKLAKLIEPQRTRFVKYMRIRWASQEWMQCQTGYAMEWARRFKDGIEYHASDLEGLRVLRQLDKEAHVITEEDKKNHCEGDY
jgi:hypothetical protein